ncbi:Virulence factor BrkB [Desulfonauticus submarinus]|uniref:Virulence factor BrkB n=1 Tax=Desulfonauticus submarinus TaxID=206665 RepID=A0A1H0DXS5_9BACT|nr:YihY/virulence factor BrkB family protein [Desulfonauticus submarinus]SDN74823.1 Virulence factor BrkB [Desulfonauticus submarinus]
MSFIKHLLKTIWQSTKAFLRQQGFLYSAGLTFYALLSFIPLICLFLSLAGLFWGDTLLVQQFIQTKLAILPWAKKLVLNQLNNFLQSAPSFSGLSFIFIFWTSGLFFSALQTTFNFIYQKSLKKKYWHLPLPWLIGPLISISLLALMFIMQILKHIPNKFLPSIAPDIWTILGMGTIIFLLYQVLPAEKQPFWPSIYLSLCISFINEIITKFFSHILWNQPNYSLVYGTLSSIVLFLLWLNANMILILWGAYFLLYWTKNK